MSSSPGSEAGHLFGDADQHRRRLGAVRRGEGDPASPAGEDSSADPLWAIAWAGDTDLDPRLVRSLSLGPTTRVTAVAWGIVGERPVIAIGSRDEAESPGTWIDRLRILDVHSGSATELPCSAWVRCLTFVETPERQLLLSGHRGGTLQLWSTGVWSPLKTVDAGDGDVVDVIAAGSDAGSQAATLDLARRVRRWSLPSGEPLGDVAANPRPWAICGGPRPDGRPVLVTAGDEVAWWDLATGTRLPLLVPDGLHRVHRVMLTEADGRARVTVVEDDDTVSTFDPESGIRTTPPVKAHRHGPREVMAMADSGAKVVGNTLAVPTHTRVHLWDRDTSEPSGPALAGPVTRSVLRAVRWQGRDLLLTVSAADGTAALWDVDRPVVRRPGHGEPVVGMAVADPGDTVVSVDAAGTIVVRDIGSGHLMASPLATGIEETNAIAGWREGDDVIAAAGGGNRYVPDGKLRWWNLSRGEQHRNEVAAYPGPLEWMATARRGGEDVLVTYGAGSVLTVWRLADGERVEEHPLALGSRPSGFASGTVDGRPHLVISTALHPMRMYALDDLSAPPVEIAAAGNDVVFGLAGENILTAAYDRERKGLKTIRAWHESGTQVGPGIRREAEITAAAVRDWPAIYVGRADGSVFLIDVETGSDLCRPLLLPLRPRAFAPAADGGLIVAFGADLARVVPPLG